PRWSWSEALANGKSWLRHWMAWKFEALSVPSWIREKSSLPRPNRGPGWHWVSRGQSGPKGAKGASLSPNTRQPRVTLADATFGEIGVNISLKTEYLERLCPLRVE